MRRFFGTPPREPQSVPDVVSVPEPESGPEFEPEPVSIVMAPPSELDVPRSGAPTARDILSTWMRGKSKTTLKTYLQDLRALAKWLGAPGSAEALRHVLSLTGPEANAMALQWLGTLKDAGLSSSTRARRLSTLKSVTEISRIMGAISWKIEVRGPRVQTLKDTSGPGIDVSNKMIDACGNDKWGKRDLAILLLGLTMGLRREEICKLELKSYNASTGKLFVEGKGDKDKTFTVPEETAEALDDWLDVRGTCDHQGLFIGAKTRGHLTVDGCYYIVKKLARKAGVKHVAPHGLRHTAITTALDENHSIREVKDFSRHSKVDTVMIYDDNKQDFSGKIAQKVARRFKRKDTVPEKPTGYEKDLSEYHAVLIDTGCSEPVAWGFALTKHLGEEKFEALKRFGMPYCISMGKWVLVVKWLTSEEAEKKYGPVTSIERGPKGAFKSITYGNKRFVHACMQPGASDTQDEPSLEDILETAEETDE